MLFSRLALKGGHFPTNVIKSILFLFSNSFHFFVIFSCWSLPRIYAVSSFDLRLLCVTARQMNPSRRLTQVSRNLQVISNWTDWTKKMTFREWLQWQFSLISDSLRITPTGSHEWFSELNSIQTMLRVYPRWIWIFIHRSTDSTNWC